MLGRIPAGAQLHGAKLQEIVLEAADLTEANFTQADLTKANLNHAHFTRACFDRAILQEARAENIFAFRVASFLKRNPVGKFSFVCKFEYMYEFSRVSSECKTSVLQC